MTESPQPPETYDAFIKHFPELHQAWEKLAEAGNKGPLDEKTRRLIKLAIAVGGAKEGAVRANVRKALAMGIPPAAIHQLVTLAAGTVGLPATVAVYSWARETMEKEGGRGK